MATGGLDSEIAQIVEQALGKKNSSDPEFKSRSGRFFL